MRLGSTRVSAAFYVTHSLQEMADNSFILQIEDIDLFFNSHLDSAFQQKVRKHLLNSEPVIE